MNFATRPPSDVVIFGAGVIGLSLALELRFRGHTVLVLDRGTPLAQASTAAAGMLAVEDPHNPPQLLALSRLSASLYPVFLSRIEQRSGSAVPFQTETTWQTLPDGTITALTEHSIDPRQLAPALYQAATASGVHIEANQPAILSHTSADARHGAEVYTTGSWSALGLPVVPRKGQMLRVRLPLRSSLHDVFRSEQVYVVPRTRGPQAGTALIGATVEDAGFDTTTSPGALAHLRQMGAELVPEIGDAAAAPAVEAWAGLRPATADGLPILGRLNSHEQGGMRRPSFVATGHYRNGILLAPATAVVMADLIEGRTPSLDLQPFSTARFRAAGARLPPSSVTPDDIRPLPRDNRFGNLT